MSRSCRCPVLWAETVPNRKKIPLEPQPCPPRTKGALFVVDGKWAYSLRELSERVAERDRLPIEQAEERVRARYPAHVAHFTVCQARPVPA